MIAVRQEPRRRPGTVRNLVAVFAGLAVALALVGTIAPSAEAASKKVSWTSVKVIRWKDGDTVVTSRGTIRLIGVDTPETGRCGSTRATNWAKKWAPAGSTVKLGNPKSVKDKDGYGRSLRYVKRGKVDISKSQIVKGAKARYDSKDGYQWHPRQSTYHKADKSHKNYRCTEPKAPAKPKHPGKTEPTSKWDCPSWAPIKGNQKPAGEEWIYHMPWNQFYNATTPEECFSTEEAASAAGYRAARI